MNSPMIGETVEWMEPNSIGTSWLTIRDIRDGMIHASGYEATAMGGCDVYIQTDAAGWETYRKKAWETRARLKAMRRSR